MADGLIEESLVLLKRTSWFQDHVRVRSAEQHTRANTQHTQYSLFPAR